jgi:hypothetical protein
MIILGSHSIQHILGRESKDIDVLATLPDFQDYLGVNPTVVDKDHVFAKKGNQIFDCELIWDSGLGLELARLILSHSQTRFDQDLKAWIPNLNILYMLKMTHRFKKNSPHFRKTMNDIHLMRKAGAIIEPAHMDFFKRRQKETLYYEHPNLNRSKDEFFNPEDNYMVYDHDSIHLTVALYGQPAYESYKTQGNEVLTSRKMFETCPKHLQLAGVYEEAAVLALERHQIPNRFAPHYLHSAQIALEKVCTSITSGHFREFAWENYDNVLHMFRNLPNFVENFHKNKHMLIPYIRKET